jgi:hypothetical protein
MLVFIAHHQNDQSREKLQSPASEGTESSLIEKKAEAIRKGAPAVTVAGSLTHIHVHRRDAGAERTGMYSQRVSATNARLQGVPLVEELDHSHSIVAGGLPEIS